ncbi:MAG: methyltransferase domain-containing protein [Candidatus Sericytochromatia bacterium]|nr:methyltransferase domain-containing protein [Candidatus Sericytochromatia bacterium]
MADALLFLKHFLSHPSQIGSLLPSGPYLVRALLDGVDFAQARTVVEYGPGTGVFTAEILRRLHPDARFLSIELMDDFYTALRARYDDPRMTLVKGSAADIADILAAHDLPAPDAIVSGLPFTSLPDPLVHQILTESCRVLAPGGRFLLYQYTRYLTGHLDQYFSAIESRWTLRNVPPAFSFVCRHPRIRETATV